MTGFFPEIPSHSRPSQENRLLVLTERREHGPYRKYRLTQDKLDQTGTIMTIHQTRTCHARRHRQLDPRAILRRETLT